MIADTTATLVVVAKKAMQNRGARTVNATWFNYVDVIDGTSMYALVSDSGETLVETLEQPTARQRADADDTWGVVSREGVVVKTVSMGE